MPSLLGIQSMEPTKTRSAAREGSGRGGKGGAKDSMIDAGGDVGDFREAEFALHDRGVDGRDGDDGGGGAAGGFLVGEHAARLEGEVGFAERIGGGFGVAAPDGGFDVVLEEDGVGEAGDSWGRGKKKIADEIVERLRGEERRRWRASWRAER